MIKFSKLRTEHVCMVLLVLLTLFGTFLSTIVQIHAAPIGTNYFFAEGFLPDYYQYLSWIKSGTLGDILLTSRYTSEILPKALVHPLFSATGLITGFFNIPSYIALLVLRILSLCVFFITIYKFIGRLFIRQKDRILGLILLGFSTCFYSVTQDSGIPKLVEPIPWSGNFTVIGKFGLPPHHLLALSAWMWTLMVLLPLKGATLKGGIKLILLGWAIALLNPSIFLFTTAFFILGLLADGLLNSRLSSNIKILGIFVAGTFPLLFYNAVTLTNLAPWSVMFERMIHFNPPTSFLTYILALGPLFPIACLGLLHFRKEKSPWMILLFFWAFAPVFLFPFLSDGLPINYSRLFQTYQYIPIALLATISMRHLFRKKPLWHILLVTILICYGTFSYIVNLTTALRPTGLSYYNVFVPDAAVAAFTYLDTVEKSEQIVISGEYVSQMLPAFTKHRTVIGRDDIVMNYYPLRDTVFAFVDGRMNAEEAKQFLLKHHVSYALFGIDTLPFAQTKNADFPFLKPVFQQGQLTVVKVLL